MALELLPLLTLTALVVAAPARADVVCVVLGEVAVPGMAPAEVAAAWSVARRAAGVQASLVTPGSRAGCGERARVVASVDPRGDVSLSRPDQAAAGAWTLALAPLAPRDRSRELARALASAARAGDEAAALAPIDASAYGVFEPPDSPDQIGPPPAWAFGLALGATWEPGLGDAPALLGGDLELRTATLGERLQIGLRAGWRPAVEAPAAAVPTEVSALRIGFVSAWGWRFGAFEAGLGGGLELTWRRATARPPTRVSAVTVDDLALAVPLEVRLSWTASRALAIELAAGGRVFLGGPDRTWLGDSVVDLPAGGLEAGLRLCWWWNR